MLIEELIGKAYYKLTEEEKAALLREYERRTGLKLCSTCPSSFKTAFVELKKMGKKKVLAEAEVSECKYEFKEGFENSEVHARGLSYPITKDNLTDELVETYLEGHPHIQLKGE